jgi:hypothetical protein
LSFKAAVLSAAYWFARDRVGRVKDPDTPHHVPCRFRAFSAIRLAAKIPCPMSFNPGKSGSFDFLAASLLGRSCRSR